MELEKAEVDEADEMVDVLVPAAKVSVLTMATPLASSIKFAGAGAWNTSCVGLSHYDRQPNQNRPS